MKIRLGTLFSGIGAIEQTLLKMGLEHSIVFACDNGENDLKLLPKEEQKELDFLRKIPAKKREPFQKARLLELEQMEFGLTQDIYETVISLGNKRDKQQFVEQLYRAHSKFDESIRQSYLANYSINPDNFHWDVRFMDGRDYVNKVDIMVGGSPCQAFSTNGKRGGFEDTRGTLFHDYARIISEVQPRCFIFENVKGLLVHNQGHTWDTIKRVFRELNYRIYIHGDQNGNETPLLNAVDYGIPQNRERIFIVGIRENIVLKKDFCFPTPIPLTKTNKDFLEDNVDAKYYLGKKGFEFVTTHPTRAQVGRDIQKCQKANQQFNWNGDFIFEPLSAKHTKEILERAYVGTWKGVSGVIRMYTPRECLRLMGFPDSFKMIHGDNTMWRQSGNSIVVDILEHIMTELITTGVFE